jgi:zinc protease
MKPMKAPERMAGTATDISRRLPGPEDITRVELPNGIVVLSRLDLNSASVAVSGFLPAGSLLDPDEKLGLADFTASALLRGTQKYRFQEIFDQLESVGASLGIGGGTHTTSFGGKALAEDLGVVLSLLAEALRRPVFPPVQIERLRAQLLTGLAIRAQDTAEMAGLAFDQIVYAEHPYSRPDEGYPETVQAIRAEDLDDFHRRSYGPRGLVIAIVGGVPPEKAVEMVQATLGDWGNPQQPGPAQLPPLRPLTETITRWVNIPGKSQADLVMGVAGPTRTAPDYLAASLGNNILGQFGMMGRVGKSVREDAGLAYYAGSSLGGGLGPGPWEVSAGVDPQAIEPAIDLIRQEIRRFTRQPVTEEELRDSQANYIGRLPISLESNVGIASALLSLERYHLGLDYYRRYPGLVRAVTPEQVLQAASHYLDPDRLAIAVAGPSLREDLA